jgi:hypothetical protein
LEVLAAVWGRGMAAESPMMATRPLFLSEIKSEHSDDVIR